MKSKRSLPMCVTKLEQWTRGSKRGRRVLIRMDGGKILVRMKEGKGFVAQAKGESISDALDACIQKVFGWSEALRLRKAH